VTRAAQRRPTNGCGPVGQSSRRCTDSHLRRRSAATRRQYAEVRASTMPTTTAGTKTSKTPTTATYVIAGPVPSPSIYNRPSPTSAVPFPIRMWPYPRRSKATCSMEWVDDEGRRRPAPAAAVRHDDDVIIVIGSCAGRARRRRRPGPGPDTPRLPEGLQPVLPRQPVVYIQLHSRSSWPPLTPDVGITKTPRKRRSIGAETVAR